MSTKLRNSLYTVGCELTHSFFSFFSVKSQTQWTFMYRNFVIEEQFENGDKASVQSLVSASVGNTK